jgi:hypothetical protein
MKERESEDENSEPSEYEGDPTGVGFPTLFVLRGAEFDKLVELLDNPPEPSDRLRKLLSMKPPWE